MTGGLGFQLLTTFVLAYAGQEEDLPPPDAFGARYAEMADRYRDGRSDAEAQIAALDWQPDASQLAAYTGAFENAALGRLEISSSQGGLRATLNGMSVVLHGIKDDHYAARISTGSGYDDFKLQRDESGAVTAVEWDGDLFVRR